MTDHTYSDLVAGYVTGYDAERRVAELRTAADALACVRITGSTAAELLRNLDDPYADAASTVDAMLVPGRYLLAYGTYYPDDDGRTMDAQRVILVGRRPGEYQFEDPDWWSRQLVSIARFYRRAQFGTGPIDYRDYRTVLRLGGDKTGEHVQETDTISRLVYGMAAAYLLTGDDEFLEAAERGTEYLREHMRFVDRDEDVVYWYHGIRAGGAREEKLFTSEFGDDYHAIPMYEQIYALAGPVLTYRVTGDPRIAADADGTVRLFEKFFHDDEQGGWYSHIDPVLLDPHQASLGPNRSRKNWNSIGDHAPAYLVNLWLATGDRRFADLLEESFDLILRHFPRDDSPFVQERFHRDWTPDRSWGWQQDRAVVGHNLKIAWNLMRMNAVRPRPDYRETAERIGRTMPAVGSDRRRGGWYDVVERHAEPGGSHRFAWHDRKAWWQQEQAILAYLILAGQDGDQEFLRHAREAESFYNAFFLDHDEGAVYFNVLADGMPYLLGTERFKGSHAMSMYHSTELCFLATVYGRLLLRGEPLTLHFKPRPDGFADRILRVAPDALPPGRVRLEWVEIDGEPYGAFDPVAMTVKLPESDRDLIVRAHLMPVDDGETDG